ncbi:MAG: serine/threonine-protein kinase, partial [bacterium]|nr:serine/threonine-protein kinase [bacterium]
MIQQFERYEILKKLGEGGMGVVYLARDIQLGNIVALKVLQSNLTSNVQVLERFRQEAQVLEKLRHPNIVQLYRTAQVGDQLALVMEYIEGRTLDTMIGQEVGPIPYERALPIFYQILDAVHYAHQQGVIHRDLKPSNIMVTPKDEVKMMDFGIAKLSGSHVHTKTGTKLGTLFYMSPEQVLGKAVDVRSDIYSLGMTLYEMLSGKMPLNDGSSEFLVMEKIVKASLPDPRVYYPHIPDGIVNLLYRAIAKEPQERFASCNEFQMALQVAQEQSETQKQMDYKLQPLIKRAENGDADAQIQLGKLYEEGKDVQQNYKEAVKWYRKAAEQGNADAQNELGWMYSEGRGVPQDDAEAVKWYRKAAEQGHATAQYNLGWMYEQGRGVSQDNKEAVKWYRKSAEQGDKDAIERIEEIEFKNKNENKNKPINQEQVSKESIQY